MVAGRAEVPPAHKPHSKGTQTQTPPARGDEPGHAASRCPLPSPSAAARRVCNKPKLCSHHHLRQLHGLSGRCRQGKLAQALLAPKQRGRAVARSSKQPAGSPASPGHSLVTKGTQPRDHQGTGEESHGVTSPRGKRAVKPQDIHPHSTTRPTHYIYISVLKWGNKRLTS